MSKLAVIFDLDGTLLDTLDDLCDAVNHLLNNHGYPSVSKMAVRSYLGNGAAELVKLSLPERVDDETFEKYRACIFLEPTEVGRSQACVERAEAAGKSVLRVNLESEPSAAELREWLAACGVEVPASRCAIVYRGKKYISLYAPEDGEYDFCDKGKHAFRDVFTGETVKFPRQLTKADCFLFERE